MHSRSKLQTNARGMETGVEGVYEQSSEKSDYGEKKYKGIKDGNGRHHEI